MDIGGILGTIFSGGITGLIGSITNAVATYKLKQLEYQHEENMLTKKKELMELETEQIVKQGQVVKEQIETRADADVKIESYKQDKATYSQRFKFEKLGKLGKFFGSVVGFLLGLVDFLRGIIRPGSTIYFEVFMFIMWIKVYKMVGGIEELPKEALVEIFKSLCYIILYCGTTCVLWWFGGRQLDKYFQKRIK